jgi:hypothetical protein
MKAAAQVRRLVLETAIGPVLPLSDRKDREARGLKDLIAQIVLLQQVPKRQNRALIRDPIADHVDSSEMAHRRHLDQRMLHRWIAEVVPLLKQVDAQHGLQRIGRATTLARGLGVVVPSAQT